MRLSTVAEILLAPGLLLAVLYWLVEDVVRGRPIGTMDI
jgi:hypothetical protein